MDLSQVRRYLRDFQEEFNHSTGASRYSITSAGCFYDEWSLFIALVTGVTLASVHRDNVLELYSIANTCAIKCKIVLNIR
jgi:hypothetical protein